jgi:glycosyltransferase involved in cell wall biosynthesis
MKGGVGRYTYHLVRAIREKKNKNIDVHIAVDNRGKITTSTGSHPIASKDISRGDYNYIDNNSDDENQVHYGIIKKGDKKNSARLLSLLDELKPDIVNIQYERGLYEIDTTVQHMLRRLVYGSTLGRFYKKCPVPIVSTLHTVLPANEYQEYIEERARRKEGRFAFLPLPVRTAVRRWVMKRRYHLLFEVVQLSHEIISPARTIYDIVKRGTLIYHGAEPAPSVKPCVENKQRFRKGFGLPDDKMLLLAFGYIGSYKGFDILDYLKLPDDWSLVVKQNRHERGIEQPIHIRNAINLHLGYLDEVTLSKLFFSCDAMIFPYKVVSISGVLFDALAHGLPFVASNLRFFREFAEIDLGITCNRDAASFSQSVGSLAADYDRYKKNISRFIPKLRWSYIADSHIAFYSKLLSPP